MHPLEIGPALFPFAPILFLRLPPLAILLFPLAVLIHPSAFLGLTVLAQSLQNAIETVFHLLSVRILLARQLQNVTAQIRVDTQ